MYRTTALALLVGCQEFTVESDDPPPSLGVDIPLTVDAVVEDLLQPVAGKSDILFVIDDSGSMGEEQAKLARNLGVFVERLTESGTDWHAGVITTDTSASIFSGRLRDVAGYSFVSPAIPRAEILLDAAVRVGAGGSDDEKGLLAIQRALTQPTRDLQDHHRGFLRPDAGLHVIVISDEDDGSGDAVSTTELANLMRTMKADPELPITFNSIVGPKPSGCDSRDTSASYGSRYWVMTDRVGGSQWSICEDDWEPILDALGLVVSGVRSDFFLEDVPDLDSLQVWVSWQGGRREAVRVEPGAEASDLSAACDAAGMDDPCFTYAYEEALNAVRFLGLPPPEGALVRFRYLPRTAQ